MVTADCDYMLRLELYFELPVKKDFNQQSMTFLGSKACFPQYGQ